MLAYFRLRRMIARLLPRRWPPGRIARSVLIPANNTFSGQLRGSFRNEDSVREFSQRREAARMWADGGRAWQIDEGRNIAKACSFDLCSGVKKRRRAGSQVFLDLAH